MHGFPIKTCYIRSCLWYTDHIRQVSTSSALAMEIVQSCPKPSISCYMSIWMDVIIMKFHTHIKESLMMSVWGEKCIWIQFPVSAMINLIILITEHPKVSYLSYLVWGWMLHKLQPVDYHVSLLATAAFQKVNLGCNYFTNDTWFQKCNKNKAIIL